jgi:hypothetical protein
MKRTLLFYFANGIADWDLGNIRMTSTSPWISWTMYIIYEHTPTVREVERSDQEELYKETAKPKKGYKRRLNHEKSF